MSYLHYTCAVVTIGVLLWCFVTMRFFLTYWNEVATMFDLLLYISEFDWFDAVRVIKFTHVITVPFLLCVETLLIKLYFD